MVRVLCLRSIAFCLSQTIRLVGELLSWNLASE
jgi:hypothetical protein